MRHIPQTLMMLSLALLLSSAPAWGAVPPATSSHHHYRHRHHHVPRLVATPIPPRAVPRPDPNAAAPAPVPNQDASAPREDPPPDVPSLHAGDLQLHFPHLGDGYLAGSDSATMDNEHAPVVPGMTVRVPLTQTPSTPPQD